MYIFSSRAVGRRKLSKILKFLYLSMSRYWFIIDCSRNSELQTMIAQSNCNLLRWLLRRGSPLPIPNRVVKPACADGTAVMWESMSSPFFRKTRCENNGFFVLCFCREGAKARRNFFVEREFKQLLHRDSQRITEIHRDFHAKTQRREVQG